MYSFARQAPDRNDVSFHRADILQEFSCVDLIGKYTQGIVRRFARQAHRRHHLWFRRADIQHAWRIDLPGKYTTGSTQHASCIGPSRNKEKIAAKNFTD